MNLFNLYDSCLEKAYCAGVAYHCHFLPSKQKPKQMVMDTQGLSAKKADSNQVSHPLRKIFCSGTMMTYQMIIPWTLIHKMQ